MCEMNPFMRMNKCTKWIIHFFTEGSRAKIGDFCHGSQKGPSLQHTATNCSKLQQTASHCNLCNTPQHAAIRRNTLQLVATRRKMLQHTPQVWVFLSRSIMRALIMLALFTKQRALYTLKRAQYSLKRALCTLKRALCTLKTALCTLKRALCTLIKRALYILQSLINNIEKPHIL